MPANPSQRELLTELVTDLARRQHDTAALVNRGSHDSEARAAEVERRHVQVAARLDQVEMRLKTVGGHVDEVQSAIHTLSADPQRHRPASGTLASVDPGPPTTNGHVAVPSSAARSPVATPLGKVLLRVEHLSKEIGGADILTDINFEIYDNEILGLIGPNGAGKTTLMECLANLRPRTSGTFYEGDEAPADWNPSRLMFYLPNGTTPYAELYTIEVLTLFGKMFEVEPSRWERIVVDELSLVPVLQKKVSALSKGNLQRLLIALALMSPQPLLALDEPFDGLDLHQTQAMMDILRALRAQHRTLLLCIHQLNDAERICDRLLLLSTGKLVGVGTLDQLRERASLTPGQGSLEDVFLKLTGRRAEMATGG
jgi:ABC-type multidrug transport system ATPase subunit